MSKILIRNIFLTSLLVWGSIFCFLRWLKADEPLSKDATELLVNVQLYDPNLKHDPYFYTLGFDARADIAPEYLGQLTYKQRWAEFYKVKGDTTDFEKYSKQLESLKGKFLSEKDEALINKIKERVSDHSASLYAEIIQNQIELQRIYKQQTLLNQRFQYFVNSASFKKQLAQSYNATYPNYSLIMSMHKLYLGSLVIQNQAKEMAQYIEKLIVKSGHAENLIEKMVLLNMISQSINVLHDMNRHSPDIKLTLHNMTSAQLSVKSVMASEFAGFATYMDKINSEYKSSGLFDYLGEDGHEIKRSAFQEWIYEQITPFVFQKNRTENQYFSYIQPVIKMSELNNIAFKTAINEPYEIVMQITSVKNYMGQKIALLATPEWGKYVVAPRLVNQKITILNVLAKGQKIDVKQLNKNQQGFEYYEKNGELCIKSPALDLSEANEKRYRSCLKI